MNDQLPDTRAWRCLGCQAVVTWDAPLARDIQQMASPDIGEGTCPDCKRKRLWRRTSLGRRPR